MRTEFHLLLRDGITPGGFPVKEGRSKIRSGEKDIVSDGKQAAI
jgi:hypothetical protein